MSHDRFASRFAQGFEDALEYFYLLFHSALVNFALGILGDREQAEEIASDAFIKTWRNRFKLDTFGSIRAYLYTVVRRDSYLAVRKRRQTTELTDENSKQEDIIFDQLVRAETYRILYEAIKGLAPGCRIVMEMYFIEGKTSGQISKELGLDISTVKTQKFRGVTKLKRLFGKRRFYL